MILGLLLGTGLLLVWLSFFPSEARGRSLRAERTRDLLAQAGWPGASPAALYGASGILGLLSFGIATLLTGSVAVGGAFGVIAALAPTSLVRGRAARRRVQYRELWPEAIEDIISSIRAGMSLAEALGAVADRGPLPMREHFAAFAADHAVTGRFDDSLDSLKERFADPVADRVIEAIRITRDVGGTDLSTTLRSLATMLRADLRTRQELRARQSWTVNSARLAVAAPWLVLALLGFRSDAVRAFDSTAGVLVLAGGGVASVVAYWLMMRLGTLPEPRRVLR